MCSSGSTAWSSPPSYSRIRLLKREDIEATYPLLASYAINPERASTVKELAIDTDGWPNGRSCFLGDPNAPLNDPAKPVDESAHEVLESRVRGLGLSQELTDAMLEALSWKKAHLLGQKPASPDGFSLHNYKYAEAATVLLLSFCRNITDLYTGDLGFGWQPSPLREYLSKSNYGLIPSEQRAFQNLETVKLMGMSSSIVNDDRMYHNKEYLDYFQFFHRLPKFRSLILDGTAEYQADRQLFPAKTSSPSFKRIQMRHADISGALLGTILRIPKGLEEFVLSIGGLWSTDGGQPSVPLKTVSKGLVTQKETLRVLDLDIGHTLNQSPPHPGHRTSWEEEADWEDYGLYDMTDDDIKKDEYFLLDEAAGTGPLLTHNLPNTRKYGYTIGSFHDFTALTHLSINIKALMGPNSDWQPPFLLAEQPPFRLVEAMPPNLEYLCLYDYEKGKNKDIDDHVNELLEKKAELLPRLKEIKGVEEKVAGEGSMYDDNPDEEDLWERDDPVLDWVEMK